MKDHQHFLSSSLSSVVSMDLESSWAGRSWDANYLSQSLSERELRARFQKKQMEEKEQKLLRLYESQQQRAFQRVGRGSAGGSTVSLSSSTSTLASLGGGGGGGKVRQLFEERRSNGWDRSYPLDPLAKGRQQQQQQPQQQPPPPQPQQLPLAVPKTKLARGASLDRSHGAGAGFPAQPRQPARRSKSHARGEGDFADPPRANKFADSTASFRRLGHAPADELGGGFRRQQIADTNTARNRERRFIEDYQEDEINYDTLGDDLLVNGNENFTILPDNQRQEELFAKYQVRELGNGELLTSSPPPPEFCDDPLDDSYVYDKLPNVGGQLRSEEAVNVSDRFKTYNTNKQPGPRPTHRQPGREMKKAPAPVARRESASPPPPRAANAKPAARKAESKAAVAQPTGSRDSGSPSPRNNAIASSRSSQNRSTSSNNMYRTATSPKSPPLYQNNGPSKALSPRASQVKDGLVECSICMRHFAADRIKVHEEICSRTAQKKRKEYDALKHRVQGTEAEQFVRRSLKQGPMQKKPDARRSDWRRKHEEFIQTIRSAKEMQAHVAAGGKLSDLPPPPPLDTSDYIQCPHCGRRFNEAAADRHIPRCANMLHNKPKPASSSRTSYFKRR